MINLIREATEKGYVITTAVGANDEAEAANLRAIGLVTQHAYGCIDI